ncbi:MAG TPA: 30S ribosomal protein S12 [Verrucomicrobiae bacterium]|nr:30S ribosomal protein S12 [Verrucomicrobiae bacterium]
MATLRQLAIKKLRIPRKVRISNRPALEGSPQKYGACTKVTTLTPKKPCSARRAICYVRLSNRKIIVCKIPGVGHNLKKYSKVLVRGGRPNDLPAVHYTAIRGAPRTDLQPFFELKRGRSKHGVKNVSRLHKIRQTKGQGIEV